MRKFLTINYFIPLKTKLTFGKSRERRLRDGWLAALVLVSAKPGISPQAGCAVCISGTQALG